MGTKDMDEEKKTLGRAKIYTGEPEETGRSQVRTGGKARQTSADRTAGSAPADRTAGGAAADRTADGASEDRTVTDRRSRRAEPIGTKPKEHLATEPGRRRRELETEAQMRRLWALLGVLVVILIAAIVYEIVLGHANVETGSQRMDQVVQETETDQVVQETETDQVVVQETEIDQVSETEQITEAEQIGDVTTLAGLDD